MVNGILHEIVHELGTIYNRIEYTSTWGKIYNRICEVLHLTVVYIVVYTINRKKVINMMTAKVFENGRSQAIRLPKECRFTSDEVLVNKIGDIVIVLPKQNKWDSFMRAIDMFSDDFMADGRAIDISQEREAL